MFALKTVSFLIDAFTVLELATREML
jgi:hypothetical protein